MSERINLTAEKELIGLLSSFGIPLELWGQNSAKTTSHLMNEIMEGETVLTFKDGNLFRQVEMSGVHIVYQTADGILELYEEKQVFKADGRERVRPRENILVEKMKPGEAPVDAAVRVLVEELKIADGVFDFSVKGIFEEVKESPSYPGLRSKYLRHDFEIGLSKGQFNAAGYVEDQKDKVTYFKWRKVT